MSKTDKWIKRGLDKGYSMERIKKSLRKSNYPEDVIDKINFSKYGKKPNFLGLAIALLFIGVLAFVFLNNLSQDSCVKNPELCDDNQAIWEYYEQKGFDMGEKDRKIIAPVVEQSFNRFDEQEAVKISTWLKEDIEDEITPHDIYLYLELGYINENNIELWKQRILAQSPENIHDHYAKITSFMTIVEMYYSVPVFPFNITRLANELGPKDFEEFDAMCVNFFNSGLGISKDDDICSVYEFKRSKQYCGLEFTSEEREVIESFRRSDIKSDSKSVEYCKTYI